MNNEDIDRLRYFLEEYRKARDERRLVEHRLPIAADDPNAPICINCRWCQQQGFLFQCPIYEDVGILGVVYYRRKGHKPITYSDVPEKSEDCESFEPLIPLELMNSILGKFVK